jgi:hypothetical protein
MFNTAPTSLVFSSAVFAAFAILAPFVNYFSCRYLPFSPFTFVVGAVLAFWAFEGTAAAVFRIANKTRQNTQCITTACIWSVESRSAAQFL